MRRRIFMMWERTVICKKRCIYYFHSFEVICSHFSVFFFSTKPYDRLELSVYVFEKFYHPTRRESTRIHPIITYIPINILGWDVFYHWCTYYSWSKTIGKTVKDARKSAEIDHEHWCYTLATAKIQSFILYLILTWVQCLIFYQR